MHPDIKKLLAVQKVDRALARIRRDLDSLPAEQAKRQQRLDQMRQDHAAAVARLQQAEVDSRGHEKGVLAADEEVKRLLVRLNTVKNNAEYQATLFQIEAVKKERGAIEEEGLALLEQLEGMRTATEELAARAAAEQATFAEFLTEAAKIRESREAELARAGAGREDLTCDVPRELMERYRGLFEVRDGEAVCAVENNVCTGCYTQVTPNDAARLLGATSIVQCGSCQRLLYVTQ